MLRFLRIRNLAVIEAVEVEFEPGFNVLTGETGAGKSILVEAVGLLLGARASSDLVRTGETQAAIEAIFEDAGRPGADRPPRDHAARDAAAPSSTARSRPPRRCATSPRGSSSCTASTSTRRCSIRSRTCRCSTQYADARRRWPAACAPRGATCGRCASSSSARAWTRARRRRGSISIAFQLGEIEKAAPKPGEDEELAATQAGAGQRRAHPAAVRGELRARSTTSDEAVLAGLGGVWKRVGELAAIEPQFAPYLDARDGIKSQLEDLAFFLRSYADGVDASPGATAAGRGSARAARASEAEVRTDAAGRHRRRARRSRGSARC